MITLPTESERVTACINELLPRYTDLKIGDYLKYNGYIDKLIVVTASDKPEYIVVDTKKNLLLKHRSTVTIERVNTNDISR